jgi:hypothetical protein
VEVLADNMLLLEARKLKDDDSYDDDRSLLATNRFDLDLI